MRYYNSLLIFAILSVLLGTSCKKYLDKKPNTSLSTPSTLQDLRGLLDNADQMNFFTTPELGEASADNYFLPETLLMQRSPVEQSIYKWQLTDYVYHNDWGMCYSIIYNANLVLESLQTIPVTSINREEWEKIKATALFFRGYSYLNLAWIYAKAYDEATADKDLGLDLRVASDFNIPSVRSSVRATYERILADLKEAVINLPETTEHVFRPSKAAGYGTIARAYLSMRKYQDALTYSNFCITLRQDLLDYNDPLGGTSNLPFGAVWDKKEVIFHTSMAGLTGSGLLNNTRSKISPELFASYSSDDLRRTMYFQLNPTTNNPNNWQRFKGTYSNAANSLFTGIAVDEMYLTRAECYARNGEKDAALNDLNILLKKRWKKTAIFSPVNTVDANTALDTILIERRKELIHRGTRWMDLKRLNKEMHGIIQTRVIGGNTYTLSANSDYYALPLPRDIIDQTGMMQN